MSKQLTLEKAFESRVLAVPVDMALKFLNTEPPATWVKKHPFLGHKYLPIDKVEFLLKVIFKQYRIEVIKTGMLLNAVEVTVRVHYVDISTKEWTYQDGVGAWELQTQSKSGPLKPDMSNINNGAVMMALPIAKSAALKDACDHIGNVFGANLNRKDVIEFSSGLENAEEKRVRMLIESATDITYLESLKPHVQPSNLNLYHEKWNQLNLKLEPAPVVK